MVLGLAGSRAQGLRGFPRLGIQGTPGIHRDYLRTVTPGSS